MDICLLAYELGASASDASDTERAGTRPTFIVSHDPEQAALGALRRALNSWVPVWIAPTAQRSTTDRLAAGLPPTTTQEAALN